MQIEIEKVVANHENVLRTRNSEFEAELEMKRQLVEDEIEAKRWAWELREVDLKQREDVVEKDIELKRALLLKENEDINKTMLDLQKSLDSLQVRRKQVDCAKEKLQTMISETNELAALEMKLKEEVDTLRAYDRGRQTEI